MGQPIFTPEIYFGQPDNLLVVFRSFLNLHPPAVRSLANTGFARKKNLFAFVRRKNSPRPLYIATFSPTYPNYRKDILRSKQTGCISNP